MTCVAGVAEKGKVHLGSDSCGSDGWGQTIVKAPKIFNNDNFIIGFAGSFRFGQILQYSLYLPDSFQDQSVENYMFNNFIIGLQTTLVENGHITEAGYPLGGDALIGVSGRLFVLQDDFSLLEPASNYAVIGSGEHVALGVLHSMRNRTPKKRIEAALQAAEELTVGVKSPFHYLSL